MRQRGGSQREIIRIKVRKEKNRVSEIERIRLGTVHKRKWQDIDNK